MALIRGAEVVVEYQPAPGGAWADITCDVTSATWQWGATVPLGPLTEAEGGSLRVSVHDPDRAYDPAFAGSPLAGVLRVGMPIRVRVDGSPAWTGGLQSWAWDHRTEIATLDAFDAIAQLAAFIIPGTFAIFAGTSYAQTVQVLDMVGWPAGARYLPTPTGIALGQKSGEGSALDALSLIRLAELGELYARRDGAFGWHNRAGPTPPAVSATINCGGVGLAEIAAGTGLTRVRNQVIIDNTVYGAVGLPKTDVRSVRVVAADLQLGSTHWSAWADMVLGRLAEPEPVTLLRTLSPQGAEVAAVVCAEHGARWDVVTDTDSRTVRVLGMTVDLAPGVIEVAAAVVEDIPPPGLLSPYRDLILGTSGLVGYWRLGEASGTTAFDHAGANHGSYVGSPTLGVAGAIVGDVSTAVTFDGATQSMSVPDAASLDVGDAFTLEAWVNFATLTGTGVLFSKGTNGFYFAHSGSVLLVAGGGAAIGTTAAVLTTGAWQHLVWTKSGATNRVYRNGVDITPAITNQAVANTALPLLIGQDGGNFAHGTLDELAIYSRALTLAEVQAHYTEGS